ncbi:cytidylyl-2-hydroxypropylphosphonate hydrolase [Streptomyces tsukubensis]|uniref:cytidylyl-2-hydroxypropylphosphonate hydrolase n=1 Tax=Streptomyces tsukubensis TaxID=83656 RepID=UPI00344E9CBB
MTGTEQTEQTEGSERAGGTARRWRAGEHILWRYRDHGGPGRPPGDPGFAICRPVTVVRDTPELLAVWLAPGTECVRPALADGSPLHEQPLATRYTAPRTAVRDQWHGAGVLKLARPGEPWSVWLFWDEDWEFRSWYVNLEQPHTRWSAGIDSQDHFLDISVFPDRSWLWRDEDEFAEARRAGLIGAAEATRIRQAGRAAVTAIRAWDAPFRDGWEHWRPDPAWPVPALPVDWRRTPARTRL